MRMLGTLATMCVLYNDLLYELKNRYRYVLKRRCWERIGWCDHGLQLNDKPVMVSCSGKMDLGSQG